MHETTSSTVGRLAPSPTGGLHIGHARTFLVAWLFARISGGRMVLRIEDIDASRVRPGLSEAIIDDLRWLGLDWDEGPDVGGPHAPYRQSGRLDRYAMALERLKSREQVYPCTCTRAEIARAASAPHVEDEGPTYPGRCAHRSATDAASLAGRPFAWRFRVPDAPIVWDDLIRGETRLNPARVGGDFLVAREGQGPAYQLAVVVDDSAMGVNQVVRGDDLVASTPRQILLHRALEFEPPRFGHLPLVVDTEGRRLAKRDGSIKLATLRESGLDPRSILAQIGRSCGWRVPGLPFPRDLLAVFNPGSIPPDPWVINATDIDSGDSVNRSTERSG